MQEFVFFNLYIKWLKNKDLWKQKKKSPRKTIYEQFIDYLIGLEKHGFTPNEQKNLEKHHILPYHDGGSKEGSVVLCTSKNHTLAHYYRYLAYGQKGDLVAFTMRWNQTFGIKEIY